MSDFKKDKGHKMLDARFTLAKSNINNYDIRLLSNFVTWCEENACWDKVDNLYYDAKRKIKQWEADNDNLQINDADLKPICKKCGGSMKPSKALENTLVSSDDFGGDANQRGSTQSRSGTAILVDCLKCDACGHSIRQ